MNKKYAVFTMDVEAFSDTECLSRAGVEFEEDMLDGLDAYMEILDRYGIKATMFSVCRTALAAKERIASHLQNGHELALHSYDHKPLSQMTDAEFRSQTELSRKILSETFGTDILGYRAPCFGIDDGKLEILRELGFSYDSSHLGFPAARHSMPVGFHGFEEIRKGILRCREFFEFGLTQDRLFGHDYPISGGGYVRLFNWGVMKTILRDYIRRNDFYVFYLHPFELSKMPIPRLPELKMYDRFYLNYGLRGYHRKIEWIIGILSKAGYEFVTFRQLAQEMKKGRCPG